MVKRAGHDQEAPLLADVRLALGARRDIKLFRINTGQYRAMWDPKIIVRSAPDGTPDLLGCWLTTRTIDLGIPTRAKWLADRYTPTVEEAERLVRPIGMFFAIETKARYGKQSAEQIKWQAAFESVGALYILARTVDDVLKVFGTAP